MASSSVLHELVSALRDNHINKFARLLNATTIHVTFDFIPPRVRKEGGDGNGGSDARETRRNTAGATSSAASLPVIAQRHTLLHLAVDLQNHAAVEVLLRGGCLLGVEDGKGFTALHHAAYMGDAKSVRLIVDEIVRRRSATRWTLPPSNPARLMEVPEIVVEEPTVNDAAPPRKDASAMSAALSARERAKQRLAMLRKARERNAGSSGGGGSGRNSTASTKVDERRKSELGDGSTTDGGSTRKISSDSRAHGANSSFVAVPTLKWRSDAYLNEPPHLGCSVDVCHPISGRTALMLAAIAGEAVELTRILCETGEANIGLRDRSGLTALDYAAWYGRRYTMEALLSLASTVPRPFGPRYELAALRCSATAAGGASESLAAALTHVASASELLNPRRDVQWTNPRVVQLPFDVGCVRGEEEKESAATRPPWPEVAASVLLSHSSAASLVEQTAARRFAEERCDDAATLPQRETLDIINKTLCSNWIPQSYVS